MVFETVMSDAEAPRVFDLAALAAATACGDLGSFLDEAHRSLDEASWTTLVGDAANAEHAGTLTLAAAITHLPEGRIGYGLRIFLEQLIPQLGADVRPIAALHEALSAGGGNDGSLYYLVTGLEGWLRSDPARPIEVVRSVLADTAPAAFLYPAMSIGLASNRAVFLPLVLELATTGSMDERSAAIQVLGRFDGFTPAEIDQVVPVLEAALTGAVGDAVGLPLRSLLIIAKRTPAHNPIGIRAIAQVTGRADAQIRETVAHELMFGTAQVSAAFGEAALELLAATETDEAATLEAVDHILSNNLAGALAGASHALLDDLLARQIVTMKLFDATARALVSGDPNVRAATVARWLAADDLTRFVAVRDLCSGFGEDTPRFDLDFKAVDRSGAERMARRCCALMLVFPETVASILASLLRTGPAAAFPVVESLLLDPVLINYWSGPRAYLGTLVAGAPPAMANALKRVFEQHDDYKTGVEAVRDLPELRPSQHHRFLVETKRRDEQRAIGKAVQDQSVFAEIFPTSILLYGDSAIYDMHIEPGKTVRRESQMQTHEFSHELPRVDIIDPFGSWYQRDRLLRDDPGE